MKCRKCAACCIAPSISSPIPGMPNGKPAMIRCIHLNENMLCDLWGKAERPKVCENYSPNPEFCGNSFEEAVRILNSLQ
ncbi:MAG: YkgJ family cysteine cluster protein [Bacteroidales bacterium]|jgi:Fe-S-cluster containining protein|nr:YkgJ family cysteine cluster protein [Bacteroidales bacterium]MCK9498295.1 YkgJ family cysteine cluster protein [Bacteroidales bacterium]MDY0314203.1 YkgJ family cysteine cluster protein [Bacteroidales bacterium]NLB85768.1 YkgJ family cysteine cluster protein [Bacteroidales bacterium]